jgi:tRNA(Ile)-lysidine synthase
VEFCRNLGLECALDRRDIAELARQRSLGTEECARDERYAFLAESARKLGCAFVLTGHTLNDLAEDQLLRLVRGVGWPALGGMAAHDPDRALLRPLLLTSRADIEGFVSSFGLGWIDDESNHQDDYRRNRLRRHALPLLIQENPAYLRSVARLWRLACIDREGLDACLPPLNPPTAAGRPGLSPERDDGTGVFLPAATLTTLPKALRLRLYKRALDALGPGQSLLDNMLALDKSWAAITQGQHKRGKSLHQFPGDKKAVVDIYGIHFFTSKD